jgi:LemA protein
MGALLVILAIIAVLVLWAVSLYNRLVKLRNGREQAFADVDVQLRQRHDLIPQLVEAVKGYMVHKKCAYRDH